MKVSARVRNQNTNYIFCHLVFRSCAAWQVLLLTSICMMGRWDQCTKSDLFIMFFFFSCDRKRMKEFKFYLGRKYFIFAPFYVNRYIFIEDWDISENVRINCKKTMCWHSYSECERKWDRCTVKREREREHSGICGMKAIPLIWIIINGWYFIIYYFWILDVCCMLSCFIRISRAYNERSYYIIYLNSLLNCVSVWVARYIGVNVAIPLAPGHIERKSEPQKK